MYNTNIDRKEKDIMYYVYEWFIKETNEVIYVGKGTRNRYKVRKHNKLFNEMIKRFNCESRILKTFEEEKEAFEYEFIRIEELKEKNECVCNINKGGSGGTISWWTEEKRQWYSEHNCMKSEKQRQRMSKNNPMKNPEFKNKMVKTKTNKIVIEGKIYQNVDEICKIFKKSRNTVYTWIKNGETVNGKKIHYLGKTANKRNKKGHFSKKVLIDNCLFESVKQGAKFLNIDPSTLIKCIQKNQKYKEHKCQYANQQPSYTNSDKSSVEGSTTNE